MSKPSKLYFSAYTEALISKDLTHGEVLSLVADALERMWLDGEDHGWKHAITHLEEHMHDE